MGCKSSRLLRISGHTKPLLSDDPNLSSLFISSVDTLHVFESLLSFLDHLRLTINHRVPKYHPAKSSREKDFRRFGNDVASSTNDFLWPLKSVSEKQKKILERLPRSRNLRRRRRKLEWKVWSVKVWRKISKLLFSSAYILLVTGPVVVVAVAGPDLVTALLGLATAGIGPARKWYDSMWKGHVERMEEKMRVAQMMETGTAVMKEDLEVIRVLGEWLLRTILEKGELFDVVTNESDEIGSRFQKLVEFEQELWRCYHEGASLLLQVTRAVYIRGGSGRRPPDGRTSTPQ